VSELFRVGADVIGERNVSVIQEGLRAFFNSLHWKTLQRMSKYEIYSLLLYEGQSLGSVWGVVERQTRCCERYLDKTAVK
jgi:uncharacterized protein with HEPN domain